MLDSPVFTGDPKAPTPALGDNDTSIATTAFVQRSLGSFAGGRDEAGANAALTVGDVGLFIGLINAGAQIVTLPAIASVSTGATIALHNPTNVDKTIIGSGAENLYPDGTAYTSATLKQGDTVFATKEAGVWRLYGTGALKYSAQFAASLNGSTGYQKLPSGDIEQWGLYVGAPSGSDTVITLPIAMLAAPTNIEITYANFSTSEAVGLAPVLQARNSTAGTITIRNLYNSTSSFFWKVRGKV